MRMRKKPNLKPRMERCATIMEANPKDCFGKWREKMSEAKALYVELGCGKGRFTVETAIANPEVLFVAVERVPDAMIIAMERAQKLGITNVIFIDGDARELAQYFAPSEVDRIYVNFCDPWHQNRQAKRRLTHPNFLLNYRQVLAEGGQIHFKTDNQKLYEWSLFQFPKAGFALSEVTRNLHENGVNGVMTDYEEKFHLQGMPINRCVGTMGELPPEMLRALEEAQKQEESEEEDAPQEENVEEQAAE